jgi:hypothetical protein
VQATSLNHRSSASRPTKDQNSYLTFPRYNFREHVLAHRPKPHSSLIGKRPEQASHLSLVRQLLGMCKRTSVQNLFARIRSANGVQKEQLDFYFAPAVLLTGHKLHHCWSMGSSEKAAGSAYLHAQRWPAYIWQTASKRGSSIATEDIAKSIERAGSHSFYQ